MMSIGLTRQMYTGSVNPETGICTNSIEIITGGAIVDDGDRCAQHPGGIMYYIGQETVCYVNDLHTIDIFRLIGNTRFRGPSW